MSFADDARPFRILGVQQIAIGALDKGPLRALWVDLLGADPVGNYRNDSENVDEDVVSVGEGLGLVEIDLMQPLDPSRSPKVHTPPLNHIGLWVDDLRSAVAWLTLKGVRFAPGGIRQGAAGYDVCFIHPKPSDDSPLSGLGVLIELVQAPPSLIAATDDIKRSMVGLPIVR
jgi:lactoylglutathione lyase